MRASGFVAMTPSDGDAGLEARPDAAGPRPQAWNAAPCTTLLADKIVAGDLAPADEARPDTARIQQALDACPAGQSVKLVASGSRSAFLSGPLPHAGWTGLEDATGGEAVCGDVQSGAVSGHLRLVSDGSDAPALGPAQWTCSNVASGDSLTPSGATDPVWSALSGALDAWKTGTDRDDLRRRLLDLLRVLNG